MDLLCLTFVMYTGRVWWVWALKTCAWQKERWFKLWWESIKEVRIEYWASMNHALKVQPASSQHFLQVGWRTTIFYSEVYHHPKGTTIFLMVVAIRKTLVQKLYCLFFSARAPVMSWATSCPRVGSSTGGKLLIGAARWIYPDPNVPPMGNPYKALYSWYLWVMILKNP